MLALSVVLLTFASVACGDDEEAREDVPGATAAGGTPGAASGPSTLVAELPGTSSVSLNEYTTTVCGEAVTEAGSWEEGNSLRELSAGLGFINEQMSALEPPTEVAEWHHAQIAFAGVYKETVDDYLEDPGDQTEDDFVISLFFTVGPHFEPVEKAIAAMEPDVRSKMVEAGCIDDETAGTIPDDGITGTIPMEGTAPAPTGAERQNLLAGVSVAGSLDGPDERGRFLFDAEAGETYLLEVTWQDLPDIRLRIFMRPSYNWTYNSESSPMLKKWVPEVSGTYDMTISSEGAGGPYTLSVSLPGAPDTPANARYVWEGSTIRVSWNPVDGADYYNVYYSDFFDSRCSVDVHGNPRWCDELAANITATTFHHVTPSVDENHYWVVACNSDACSDTDPDSPAVLSGDGSGSPTAGGPCRAGVTLDPGGYCSVVVPGIQTGTDMFEVRNGNGCYGDICSNESLILGDFIAYANSDGSWLITRVPDVTSSDPRPASTPAVAPTPAVAQPQETARLSLGDYMAFCGGPGYELGAWEENVSLREIAVGWGTVVDYLGSVEPPEEVADWHNTTLAFLRAVKVSLDGYLASGGGQSEDDYLLATLFPLALQHQPQLNQATNGMAPDVRAQMVAAGCIE